MHQLDYIIQLFEYSVNYVPEQGRTLYTVAPQGKRARIGLRNLHICARDREGDCKFTSCMVEGTLPYLYCIYNDSLSHATLHVPCMKTFRNVYSTYFTAFYDVL